MTTLAELIARTASGIEALAAVGSEVTDEWQYVQDLGAAYRARLAAVEAARGSERADPAVVRAVERAVEEAGLVTDPHRAIDWLSTLPQVVLLALGESA